jgi:hypothetical protein
MGDFRKLLKDIQEETTSGDIATVDTKLDIVKRGKGKKCKLHKAVNCDKCLNENKWN